MTTIDRLDSIKKDFPEILKQHMGIISTTCKAAGISRATYYIWRDADPAFKEACMEAYEERKDFAESILLEKIREKDTPSVLFFLKTQAKDRGYVERVETTGKDGEALKNEVEFKVDENTLLERFIAKEVDKRLQAVTTLDTKAEVPEAVAAQNETENLLVTSDEEVNLPDQSNLELSNNAI